MAGTIYTIGHSNHSAEVFFGFLEYDWDPDAPGGVPGFDSWPKHDLSVAETNPRS